MNSYNLVRISKVVKYVKLFFKHLNKRKSMDPRHLLQLATILESGSITKATQLLHLTQPTLTHNMQILESQVGGQLFERSRHGVRSTALGEMLAREGRAISRRLRGAEELTNRHKSGYQRTIRLGVGPLIGAALIPNLLEEISRSNMRQAISIQSDRPHLLLDQLVDGKHDFVIAPSWLDKAPQGCERFLLAHDEVGVFCSAKHPVALSGDFSLETRWLSLGTASPFEMNVQEMLKDAGFTETRSEMNVMGDAHMVLASLALGKHLSVLPKYPLKSLAKKYGLVSLSLPTQSINRDIYVWCRTQLLEDESLVTFKDFLIKNAKNNEIS